MKKHKIEATLASWKRLLKKLKKQNPGAVVFAPYIPLYTTCDFNKDGTIRKHKNNQGISRQEPKRPVHLW